MLDVYDRATDAWRTIAWRTPGIRLTQAVPLDAQAPRARGEHDLARELFRAYVQQITKGLIVTNMLSDAERGWLDHYHEQVLALIGPQLEGEDRTWLETQCAPLGG